MIKLNLATGTVVAGGKYKLLASVGMGGFGEIYSGQDIATGELRAVKLVLSPYSPIGTHERPTALPAFSRVPCLRASGLSW